MRHAATVLLRIEGVELPGRRCGEDDDVHVAVQRKQEAFEQVPGDAPSATWTLDITTKVADDGSTDFAGPFVHGKRGERFVYLTWGSGSGDAFTMFRRAKIMLSDAPATTGTVVAHVKLTDSCGMPLCARVKPPAIAWSTEAG